MFKVLLPGEALIDRFNQNGEIEDKAGGAPANVAAAITKLGVEANFLGTVGNDSYGKFLQKIMIKNNVGVKGLIFSDTKTTIANVSINSQGERSFKFERGADEELKISDIPPKLLKDYDLLHLGSATAIMGGNLWNTYIELLKMSKNKIIIFDPNYRDALYKCNKLDFITKCKQLIKEADIVKVSIEELELITSTKNIDEGVKILLNLRAKIILVTLGKKGTLIVSHKHHQIIPSIKVKQIDTTGAGDSFIGYLIGQLASNNVKKSNLDSDDMLKYIRKSNICASITVTRYGALDAIPSQQEVEKIFKEQPWN